MQFSDLDLTKTYTYADYLKWTFDERLELIKGKIFKMSPAPSSAHQLVSGAVYVALYNYLEGKPCEVFPAPFDVRLTKRLTDDKDVITVVQPDICVICDMLKIEKRGCLGAPDIVIEILSPGNNKTELKNKYEVYEESGVLEYWIIHPFEKSLYKYVLVNGRFLSARPFTTGDIVTTEILPGFALNLDKIFAKIIDE
jgi:Uma2 family endonuclease